MAATRKKGAVSKASTPRKTAPAKKATQKKPAAAKKLAETKPVAGPIYETLILVEDPDADAGREEEIKAVARQLIAEAVLPGFTDEQIRAEFEPPKRKRGEAGRPSKYDPSWMLDTVMTLMIQGASRLEVEAALLISQETFLQWTTPDGDYYKPIFSETVRLAERLSEAWWLRQGRANLRDPKFNYRGWFMNMGNRFGWKAKQEVGGDPENPVGINHSGEVRYTTDWDAVEAAMKGKS